MRKDASPAAQHDTGPRVTLASPLGKTLLMTFAKALLLAFGHSLLRHLFGDVFKLTEEGWRKLTLRWGLFFVALAILNEIVWRNFTTDTWVSFKVFGIMPLTMIFGISQMGLLKTYEAKADVAGP